MTYRAAGDERSVVPARVGVSKERIYITELTQYLHHSAAMVRKLAKRWGLMRRVSIGACRDPAEYVSPYGAQRIIAHIRAIQGDAYLQGREFHAHNERQVELLRLRKQLRIAFPEAVTEGKRQRSACAKP